MFSKNTLLSFSDRYYSNFSFTKSFRKKDCFYGRKGCFYGRKIVSMDEKRFVALKDQYPVTAPAPNFDFLTGCREFKRREK